MDETATTSQAERCFAVSTVVPAEIVSIVCITRRTPAQYRARKQAALSSVNRLFTRAVLYRSLERKPHTDLDLAPRRRGLGDRAELRRVHEAAGRPQIRMIERVEEFGPELEFRLLGQAELAGQRQVQRLHPGAVDGIPPRVPEPERCRGGKRRGVEPTIRSARALAKDRLAGVVGADGILAEQRSCVGSVAENRDGERESALDLINGREPPILRHRAR